MPETLSSFVDSSNIGIHPPGYRLPATAHVGRVRLAVSQLARSVDFYTRVIGLAVIVEDGHLAKLGPHNSSTVLLELEELAQVEPIGRRNRLGLYHTAFLLPNREALSSFVKHLRKLGIHFGAGDHFVSEAVYLTDPDGLTVEVYADRDRSTWTIDNREIVSGTVPVRFAELPVVPEDSWHGMPSETTVGHLHFYVGDLEQASRFYHETLGLDIVTRRYPGALFTSAGGYHHHIGLNVWLAGSPVASVTEARLLYWQMVLPSQEEVRKVNASFAKAGYLKGFGAEGKATFTDPWGLTVALTVG